MSPKCNQMYLIRKRQKKFNTDKREGNVTTEAESRVI